MRVLAFGIALALLVCMLSLPATAKAASPAGDLAGGNGQHGAQNQTQAQMANQTHQQNQTQEQNQTHGQDAGQKNNGTGNESGISEQVRRIVEERKNGSIAVPQGMVVRIVARNHTMSVEEALMSLNETLTVNVTVNGKGRSLRLTPYDERTNITDGNVTVETNETLEIGNGTLTASGAKVLVMPSEVPQKVGAKAIKSAVLHVVNGDPSYEVNATRSAKVLWIFDADMDVETVLDAATGQVKSEKRPWWGFLASTG
jgi:hypothetical protein